MTQRGGDNRHNDRGKTTPSEKAAPLQTHGFRGPRPWASQGGSTASANSTERFVRQRTRRHWYQYASARIITRTKKRDAGRWKGQIISNAVVFTAPVPLGQKWVSRSTAAPASPPCTPP